MEFVIISGLSGAGKSRAASIMEDMGFFCVDNLPAPLIPKFAELGMAGNGEYDRVVLVTDIRGRHQVRQPVPGSGRAAGHAVRVQHPVYGGYG